MYRIPTWDARLPGDLLLVQGSSILDNLIVRFERQLNPLAPNGFTPSHAAIIAENNRVVEAVASSAAAVDSADQYKAAFEAKQAELWRIDGASALRLELALGAFIHDFQSQAYSWPNLLGFAIQAAINDLHNPIDFGVVCSQSDFYYLRYVDLAMFPNSTLQWIDTLDVTNLTPLDLRVAFLEHETK